ncbi:hypothetical protein AH68_02040 [Bifidobacterium catenulatum PV20-2]|uniref:Uncharacterized protein n=1 Tax=Bifidobacterium catenulatum PV20-2 TaxID=1447716 RepID=A0A0A7I829_9BIFI|nr:hypothetical protein AH68_02040 [Bifidobacterium catenulatum PV20-2]
MSSVGKRDGGPVSTKHGGTGLDTETVRGTAERHHGMATFDYGEGVFQTSAMLCLDDEHPHGCPLQTGAERVAWLS